MANERLEEARKWVTTVSSVAAVVLIPIVGYTFSITVKNLKLEIERDVAQSYLTKATFSDEKSSHDKTDQVLWKKLTEISSDVRVISNEQVREQDGIASLKEGFSSLREAIQKQKP